MAQELTLALVSENFTLFITSHYIVYLILFNLLGFSSIVPSDCIGYTMYPMLFYFSIQLSTANSIDNNNNNNTHKTMQSEKCRQKRYYSLPNPAILILSTSYLLVQQKFKVKFIDLGSLKDGVYYCYCAYVLRISRYSDFLLPMLANTGVFLRSLKLSGES